MELLSDFSTLCWKVHYCILGESRRGENVTAEHINLSLVEFELFCGEKGWRKGEEEEKKKWANFLLLVFNARRRGCSTAAAVAQQFQNA